MHLPYLGDFRITKLYGTPPPAGMKYAAGKHPGLDLVGVVDKQVRALLGGTVYKSGFDVDGWGKYTVIKQTDGIYAIYCHLSKAFKSTGQAVQAGEWIGNEGATGQVTGQHLHLELRTDYNNRYATINPTEYLGIENKVGLAKVVNDVREKEIIITVNGKDKKVLGFERDGHIGCWLKDLRDEKIVVGYSNGKPSITVR